ncbi:MAG: hypothetical protein EAZ09_19585 [Oscillatoriales cyanobacterium]|nr:MAG: hypothetical protein EAZ59_06080 [Oscillatoriales cyanobacterium]TAG86214.1 MAG: hypothetical protein EAZ18_26060 [Oscillatoriales cyanobacterium]TAH17686.1 MAG: hypothetical protein EAZ09_19585 [Oscillatoriales cyanobacterium]
MIDVVFTFIDLHLNLLMGAQKPGFFTKYFVAARRFAKKPGFFFGVRKSCNSNFSTVVSVTELSIP